MFQNNSHTILKLSKAPTHNVVSCNKKEKVPKPSDLFEGYKNKKKNKKKGCGCGCNGKK